jgi:hypothetical protein
MRAVVSHDRDGTIASLALCPADGPPLAAGGGLDLQVTELDVPDDVLESIRQEGHGDDRQSIEALAALRVELKREARLVRKG